MDSRAPLEITGAIASGSLYEFHTRDGVHVSLHEAALAELTVRPLQQAITLRFAAPDVGADVVYALARARVDEWADADAVDKDPDGIPNDARGQVGDLSTFGRYVQLVTIEISARFWAESVTVTLEPWRGDAGVR